MSLRSSPTYLVAAREVREATKTKAFRISLVVSAAVLAAIIVIANLGSDEPSRQTVVVAGADAGQRADGIERLGAAAGIALDVETAPDDSVARAAVDDGDADVAIAADGATLTTREPVDLDDRSDLGDLVNVLRADLALENGLSAVGLTPEQVEDVRATPPPTVVALRGAETEEVDGGAAAAASVTNILLFLLLQSYGAWVLTSVTREKASRVVEVLLAMITPRQLLVGKLVGIGVAALGHAAGARRHRARHDTDRGRRPHLGDRRRRPRPRRRVVPARLLALLRRLRRRRLAGVAGRGRAERLVPDPAAAARRLHPVVHRRRGREHAAVGARLPAARRPSS